MRKTVIISILVSVIVLIGFFVFIKLNQPLESGTISIGTLEDQQLLMLEIGNKGFGDIQIKRVLVNDSEEPVDTKIQVSNPLKGFIIPGNFTAKGNTDIKDVKLLPRTSPSTNLEKVNNGTATEKDHSYGLTLINRNPIYEVIIYYTYLGLSFEKKIPIAIN